MVPLPVAANLALSSAYLAICFAVALRLLRRHQVGADKLGAATAAVFVSGGIGLGVMSVDSALPLLSLDAPTARMTGWPTALMGALTACVAVYYWSLRRSYGVLTQDAAPFEDLRDQQVLRDLEAREEVARVRAEAVIERMDLFGAVFDSLDEMVFLVDLDGVVLVANAVAQRILATGPEAEVARFVDPTLEAVRADGSPMPADERATAVALSTGRPVHGARMGVRGQRGERRWLSVTATPLFHPGEDGPYGVVTAARDVTDEHDAEALRDRFRQYERLESLGKLVGGIAHDFNNLMAIVLAHTEFVEQSTAGNPEARADLAHVRDAADRAAALTRHLLTFARNGSARGGPLSVNEVVAGTTSLLSRTLGADVRLDVHRCAEDTTVRADAVRLEQVVVNLAVNARDAMPDGGLLRIETSIVHLEAGQPGLTPPPTGGSYVLLEVTDTGTGMTRQVLEHLFEPFFTTKDTASGTGLGLATVWGIVSDLGGSLGVGSEPGRGSCFAVYLPRVQDHRAPAADPSIARPAVAAVSTAAPGHRGSVLLVEDEDALRHVIARVLRRAGFEVVAVADGEQALAAATDRRFDLLFTDVVMPGQSGPAVAAALRELHPGTHVLFMSGYTRGALGPVRSIDDDVDVVSKPFDHGVLVQRVTAAMARARAGAAPPGSADPGGAAPGP